MPITEFKLLQNGFVKVCASAFFLFSVFAPLAGSAQQDARKLTDTQILGRRVFQQYCAVCHTEPTPGARVYGPVLYKELIQTNETFMTEFIRRGSSGKMPAFKYGLEAKEIDAIIDYLKTVPKSTIQSGVKQENPLD